MTKAELDHKAATVPHKPGIGVVVKHNTLEGEYSAVVVAQYYHTQMCCIRWVDINGAINYAHGIEVVDEA